MNLNLEQLTKALDWLLSKGTIITGAIMALGCLAKATTLAMQLPFFGIPDSATAALNGLGWWIFGFFVSLGITSLIYNVRRAEKQRLAIAAEQIRLNPDLPDKSSVPEVQKEIASQIVEGK